MSFLQIKLVLNPKFTLASNNNRDLFRGSQRYSNSSHFVKLFSN